MAHRCRRRTGPNRSEPMPTKRGHQQGDGHPERPADSRPAATGRWRFSGWWRSASASGASFTRYMPDAATHDQEVAMARRSVQGGRSHRPRQAPRKPAGSWSTAGGAAPEKRRGRPAPKDDRSTGRTRSSDRTRRRVERQSTSPARLLHCPSSELPPHRPSSSACPGPGGQRTVLRPVSPYVRRGPADIVMKSRAHQDSKYRPGDPVMLVSSSDPFPAAASPAAWRGRSC